MQALNVRQVFKITLSTLYVTRNCVIREAWRGYEIAGLISCPGF